MTHGLGLLGGTWRWMMIIYRIVSDTHTHTHTRTHTHTHTYTHTRTHTHTHTQTLTHTDTQSGLHEEWMLQFYNHFLLCFPMTSFSWTWTSWHHLFFYITSLFTLFIYITSCLHLKKGLCLEISCQNSCPVVFCFGVYFYNCLCCFSWRWDFKIHGMSEIK